MPEETPRTLNHFALYAWKEAYWALTSQARTQFHREWLQRLRASAPKVDVYQVFPAEKRGDLMIWATASIIEKCDTAGFFEKLACATNPFRAYLDPVDVLWGYTRPSQYTKTRSTQE